MSFSYGHPTAQQHPAYKIYALHVHNT